MFDFCVKFGYRLRPRVILVLSASQSASVRSWHQAVWFDRRQRNAAGTVPTGCKRARNIQMLKEWLSFTITKLEKEKILKEIEENCVSETR